MALGVLYPFFTDFDVPIINDPKYISIGALLLGMVLFWEFYGSKKYDGRDFTDFGSGSFRQARPQQPSQQYSYPPPPQGFTQSPQPYPQYQPPQSQNYGQSLQYQPHQHAPSYDDMMFSDANIPQATSRVANPLYKQKTMARYKEEIPEKYVEEEINEEQDLPKVSDVIKGKAKLPTRIPPPRDVPVSKTTSKSAFKKFGL